MWFQKLTGFEEETADQVRSQLQVGEYTLTSLANGKTYRMGHLETPTLASLREQTASLDLPAGSLRFQEIVNDVQALHRSSENEHALFQAASQFNLLEMVSPAITPEAGIDRYENDHTQGPACALACGAGTIYRQYLVPLMGQLGQTERKQIDCLYDVGLALDHEGLQLWEMKNGYALISQAGALHLNQLLNGLNEEERDDLKSLLRIGIQWDTEVTLPGAGHLVSQAYCSGLPVAYTSLDSFYFERFARVILEAAYEATMHAALLNGHRTGNYRVYLTMLGGGAFGNPSYWIVESLAKVLAQFELTPLDVKMVSYDAPNPSISSLLNQYGPLPRVN